MPTSPGRLCCHANCDEIVHPPESHCAKHKTLLATRDVEARGSAASRGYDARHRRWRLFILRRDPICKDCGRAPSNHADHIVALAQGGTWALSNGQGLCETCHNQKTAREVNASR